MKKARILLIDNFDSFTYNIVQAFLALGANVITYRNDAITVNEAYDLEPSHLLISPGPGRPENAGVSLELIAAFAGSLPIFGVCLGHQCIVSHFGGEIVRADRLMHGKTSPIAHDGLGIYDGLSQQFEAGRYHSLGAQRESMPDELTITAQTDKGEIMGVRHREWQIEGVQFHPESVLTPEGDRLMANFLRTGQ